MTMLPGDWIAAVGMTLVIGALVVGHLRAKKRDWWLIVMNGSVWSVSEGRKPRADELPNDAEVVHVREVLPQ